ncbi:MAG: 50S ribosomal protein L3 [Candidatus Shapirobacteria bacterium]|nr:50S ribosomal protein L3 [Candidatus Shapirobacteria bacterium]
MINGLIGKKGRMSQDFTKDGKVVPLTVVEVNPCRVLQVKTIKTDGYKAVKLAYGQGKGKYNKGSTLGEAKKAKLEKAPGKIMEIRNDFADTDIKVGQEISLDQVFSQGDKVCVTGISKGRGFAGVIKRWGFHGGPKTHGQSDRLRAPGSIGQGTDPGRVHKGKKMPGHYGTETVTVKNLKIFKINKDTNRLYLTGAIPGARGGYLKIIKSQS